MAGGPGGARDHGAGGVRRGSTAFEWYAEGWNADRPHGTASMAKALIGGVSLLVARSDGRIAADDLASKYIPDWMNDPCKAKITIRHLATHTSGIEDAEQGNIPHEQLPGWKGAFWKRDPDPFSIAGVPGRTTISSSGTPGGETPSERSPIGLPNVE